MRYTVSTSISDRAGYDRDLDWRLAGAIATADGMTTMDDYLAIDVASAPPAYESDSGDGQLDPGPRADRHLAPAQAARELADWLDCEADYLEEQAEAERRWQDAGRSYLVSSVGSGDWLDLE